MGAFKTASTKRINEIRGTPGGVIWQRSFYEHIIGSDKSFDGIVAYIHDNPARWEVDPDNPTAMNPDRKPAWR